MFWTDTNRSREKRGPTKVTRPFRRFPIRSPTSEVPQTQTPFSLFSITSYPRRLPFFLEVVSNYPGWTTSFGERPRPPRKGRVPSSFRLPPSDRPSRPPGTFRGRRDGVGWAVPRQDPKFHQGSGGDVKKVSLSGNRTHGTEVECKDD